ncbi:Putative RxLR effector [Phytophthora palmivora]|uniref:RxLR effector protein n=1 Tax=Phytophthora palmivora TaxID=4796 RepID=A0A2P4XXV9_9STRA|nr:Putative RxLR effector [Phytophthora palmivora]
MRSIYNMLLVVTLFFTGDAAGVDHPKPQKVASLDMPVWSRAILSLEDDNSVINTGKRSLRADEMEEKRKNPEEEERAINLMPREQETAFLREAYNNPLLVKFDNFIQKIRNKYLQLIGKTPEQAKKYYGVGKYKTQLEAKHH